MFADTVESTSDFSFFLLLVIVFCSLLLFGQLVAFYYRFDFYCVQRFRRIFFIRSPSTHNTV